MKVWTCVCVERGCGDMWASVRVCYGVTVQPWPLQHKLEEVWSMQYAKKKPKNTFMEQTNQSRQIKKKKVLQKAGVQTQIFKNLPWRSYQNIKIISQFVHIVALNKISLLFNHFSPQKPTTLHLYIHSPLSPEDVCKLSSGSSICQFFLWPAT